MNSIPLYKIKKYILDIRVEISDFDDDTLRLGGIIKSVYEDGLFILLDNNFLDSEIYLNKTYLIKILRDNSLFCFEGSIFSIQNKITHIKILSPIKKIQKRKYCRLKILCQCLLYFPMFNMVKESIIYNISEGGVAIITPQILLKNDNVLIDIPFLNFKKIKGTVLNEINSPLFEIISMDYITNFINLMNNPNIKSVGEFSKLYNKTYAIEFNHENQKHPDAIRKFIFDMQLKRIEDSNQFITY
ncbi:MAG: hypothetical protein GX308_07690 [Epulopiscium sp.]|nr:hypothetical protein [Candidatus Epulonipiscium sp.]